MADKDFLAQALDQDAILEFLLSADFSRKDGGADVPLREHNRATRARILLLCRTAK
jgi:hypothetical protein